MDVYADLITPDLRVLELMTSADLAMFCSQWTASLLSHPMNALPWVMDDCSGSAEHCCRAMIMLGAIALARAVRLMLNTSVYLDDRFANLGASPGFAASAPIRLLRLFQLTVYSGMATTDIDHLRWIVASEPRWQPWD